MTLPPPRRIVLLLTTVVVAAVCVRLGFWQLDRLEQRRAANERIRAAMADDPIPVVDLIMVNPADVPDLAYRPVELRGTYAPEGEVALYGRALDGSPGSHVLTPLILADGIAILVDRGWVPRQAPGPPFSDAAPPAGEVTISAILLPPATGEVVNEEPGRTRVISAADPGLVLSPDLRLLPVVAQLREQDPAQQGDLPIAADPPALDEGPHASYAFQWFTFAAIAVVGYVVLARRDRRGDERAIAANDPSSEEAV